MKMAVHSHRSRNQRFAICPNGKAGAFAARQPKDDYAFQISETCRGAAPTC
jgi:hypothetical protein